MSQLPLAPRPSRHSGRPQHPRRFIAVGPCYIDIVLRIPRHPPEFSTLPVTSFERRRTGSCPNLLEVLQQLVYHETHRHYAQQAYMNEDHVLATSNAIVHPGSDTHVDLDLEDVQLYLMSVLPSPDQDDTLFVRQSFNEDSAIQDRVVIDYCIFRSTMHKACTNYIMSAAQHGSRTILEHTAPEAYMQPRDFADAVNGIADLYGLDRHRCSGAHFHFECLFPDVLTQCIQAIRGVIDDPTVSIDIDQPGQPGMEIWGRHVDYAFFSHEWARAQGIRSPLALLKQEAWKCMHISSSPTRALFCIWANGAAGCYVSYDSTPTQILSLSEWTPPEAVGTTTYGFAEYIGKNDAWIAGMLHALLYIDDPRIKGNLGAMLNFANETASRKIRRQGFSGLGAEMRPPLS